MRRLDDITRSSVLALLIAAGPSEAARPLDTEDTGTVAAGHVELELGTAHARMSNSDAVLFGGVLSGGVTSAIEARVESGVRLIDDGEAATEGGIGDTLLGLKWIWIRESLAAPAVLGGFTLRLPTGDVDRGLGAEGVDAGVLVAVSRVLGDFQATGNAGYTLVADDRSLDFWTATGALEWAGVPGTVFAGEISASIGHEEAPESVLARVGLVHAMSTSLKLDLAAAAGLTESSPDFVLTAGLTIAVF